MIVLLFLYSFCWFLVKDDVSYNVEVNNFKVEK